MNFIEHYENKMRTAAHLKSGIKRNGGGKIAGALIFLWMLAISVCSISAQSTASLSGVVLDGSKAVVSGATVSAFNYALGTTSLTTSNAKGYFHFPFLAPGGYRFTIKKQGFADTVDVVTLATSDKRELEVDLNVAGSNTSVIVRPDATNISTSVDTTVDQEFIKDLPLNGRTFQSLIAVTPGVSRTGGAGLFSFNGQRDNTNYFTLDGVAANTGVSQTQGAGLGQYGAGQAPDLSAVGTTSSLLAVDAMQEIKIQSSTYSPEFGRSAGGQIQITSKGGTDRYHGSLFDYFRNDAFDAYNSYTKFLNVTLNADLPKPPLRMNDFGGTLGGPVRIPGLYNGSGKTFFFVSYEGLRLDQPTSGFSDVVPLADRTAGVYPALQPYLSLPPLPTGVDQYGNPAIFASYGNPNSTNATSVRIDEKVNDKLSLFGRFGDSPSYAAVRSIYTINEVDTTHNFNKSATLGATLLITQHLVNQFTGNWTKTSGNAVSTLDTFDGSVTPTAAMYSQMFPSQFGATQQNSLFVFGDYQPTYSYGFQVGTSIANTQRQINLIDSITWSKGTHVIKIGADWLYLFPISAPNVYSQSVAYYAPADLASGDATVAQVQSVDTVVVHQQETALFAGDTWSVTPNLTINYGIRWDYFPPPYGVDGQSLFAVQNPYTVDAPVLAPAGTPLYSTQLNQFQPRIGAAYVINRTPGKETMLRAGFGTFYVPAGDTAMQATNYFPHTRYTAEFGTNWFQNPPPPIPETAGPPYPNQNLLDYAQGFVTPRTFEWNLQVQQNLGSAESFTLAYVASAGRNLTRQAAFTGDGNNYLNLFENDPIDFSNYESLQASYVRQMNHGIQIMANYTWSKSLDTASNDLTISPDPNYINVSGEYGPSDFNQTNVGAVTFDWNLPGVHSKSRILNGLLSRWGMDGIFQAHTGNPVNVTFTELLPGGIQTATVRPDLVPDTPIYIPSTTFGGKELNAAAFSTAFVTDGSGRLQGNESRNSIAGPNFSELDYTARKTFTLFNRVNLQYRVDFFNILNSTEYAPPTITSLGTYTTQQQFEPTPLFGGIQGTLSSTAAGQGFFGVGGARSIQMALRINF